MCSDLISFYTTTHPVPGVVSGVKLQQIGCVFSQHSHIFSGLGQLVPAYIELPELSQHSQPFESHEVVIAGIQKLKVGLQFRWQRQHMEFVFTSFGTLKLPINPYDQFKLHNNLFHFTMWEMSSRWVNSLELMVRCRSALRLEISFILLKLLPWRFTTWTHVQKGLLWEQEMMWKWSCFREERLLTVIWLRTLALATLSRIFSSKLKNLGCGFSTGSMSRTFLSRMISLEVSSLPVLWSCRSGCSWS